MNTRTLVLGTILAVFLVAGAGPVTANYGNGPPSAGIVERFSVPGAAFWVDPDDGLLAAANFNSVADFCDGIPAGLGDLQDVRLPGGVVVELLHADDVPILVMPLAPPFVICADPDSYPVMTGVGSIRLHDNDRFASGTRTNSYGIWANGSVVDGAGDVWSFQASYKARVTKGALTEKQDIHLVPRG